VPFQLEIALCRRSNAEGSRAKNNGTLIDSLESQGTPENPRTFGRFLRHTSQCDLKIIKAQMESEEMDLEEVTGLVGDDCCLMGTRLRLIISFVVVGTLLPRWLSEL
jgi:hypothetical protein